MIKPSDLVRQDVVHEAEVVEPAAPVRLKGSKPTPERFWYVSEGSAGFTSMPDMAKKDIRGVPIIAPGYVKIIIAQERRKGQNVLDMLFEALLDAMEQIWDMEEKPADQLGGDGPKEAALNVLRGYALGLAQAIAAQKYTALYLNPETREQAIEKVRQEALAAFDEDGE